MKRLIRLQIRVLRAGILLGTIISTAIALTAYAQPTNCTASPTGLVGWWRGEGNANDSVGGHNGVLVNGTTFAPGEVLTAFDFDGVQNYITNALPGLTNIRNSYTIEFWAWPKASRASTAESTTGLAGTSNQRYAIFPHLEVLGLGGAGVSVGTNGVSVFEHGPSYLPSLLVYDTPIVGWVHIAVVYSNRQPRLYLNGFLVRTGLTSIADSFPSTCFGEIGVGYGYYAGLLDEVSIYDRALSAAEIQTIYNACSAGKCAPGVRPSVITQPASQTVLAGSSVTFTTSAAGTPPLSYQWYLNGTNIAGATDTSLTLNNVQAAQAGNCAVWVANAYGSTISSNATLTVNVPGSCVAPPTGLVGWWRGESNANDSVGGHNGVLVNGTSFAPGEVLTAFDFDGVQNYITNALPGLTNIRNSYTIEFWAWPKASRASTAESTTGIAGTSNQRYAIFPHLQVLGLGGAGVSVGTNGVSVFEHGPSYLPSLLVYDAPIVGWTHIAVVYSNRQPRLYLNGFLVRTGLTSIADSFPSTCFGEIGVAYGYYAGLLDEVSIYDRALSAAEIQTIYNAGSAGKCSPGVLPVIVTQPASQTVLSGSTATFSVTAGGTSPLSYQWALNGTNIAGATNTSLTLSNVQFTNAGTYDVTVTNLYGATKSSGVILVVLGTGACALPPAGLVSWWAGDGTALDSVGTNNGALVNGAGFGVGEVGQAFSFDGNTQSVMVPYSPSLVATNYSVEAWVKPLSQVSDPINQELLVGQPYGWELLARPGTSGVVLVLAFANSSGTWYSVVSSSQITIGQFSHVLGNWDGTTLRLYINGVLDAQNVPGATPADSGRALYIGGSQADGPPVQCFHGLIDEASYYNRALSGLEVQTLYNAGSAGKCHTPVAPLIQTPPQSQIVALGTNASFSVVAAGTGPLSYQWHYNGGDIAGATSSVLALTNVQFSNAGTYNVLVSNLYGATNSSAATLTVLNGPQITGQPQDQTVGVGSNVTFSVAATGSGPLNYQWYFNGAALSGATSTSLLLSGVTFSQAGSYQVSVSNPVGAVWSRNAILVVVANAPCTPSPAGLVSWWAADATALDSVGTNNGVLVNGAGFGVGEVGQAFSFDGNTQSVMVPYSPSLAAANFSVEAWIKPLSQVSDPINQELLVGQPYGWELLARPGTSGVVLVLAFADISGTYDSVVSGSQIPIGQFSHVVGNWDGTTLRLYINGVLDAQNVPGATPADSGRAIYIGGSQADGPSVQCFHGLIDEASYYNRALSGVDVQALYNAGTGGKCKPTPASILMPPQSETVECGSNATFSVSAEGWAPLSYRWYLGSSLIAGATNAVLTLINVGFAQAGSYSVVVSNAYGSATGGPAMLTVVDTIPPTILSCASNCTVSVGANCTVSVPDLTTQVVAWDASGPLTVTQNPAPGVQVGLGTTNVTFTVQDGSGNSSVCSSSFTAQDTTPPFIQACVLGLTLDYDNNCQAVLPDLTSTNYVVASDNCSAVNITQQPPAGTIMPLGTNTVVLTVSDAAGNQTTRAVPVVVSGAPRITAQPANVSAVLTSNALFLVTACGTSPLAYQWEHATTNLPSATNAVLTLSNIKTNDAGEYRVVVANSSGSITSVVATLTVLRPPVITRQPKSLAAVPGSAASFSVAAQGLTPFAYQWQRNGSPLADETKASLALTNLQPQDFGTYTVVVTNADGAALSGPALLTHAVSPAITALDWNAGTFMLTIPTELGPSYVLEYKNNLEDTSWTFLTTISGTGLPIPITDNGLTITSRFYRVQVR